MVIAPDSAGIAVNSGAQDGSAHRPLVSSVALTFWGETTATDRGQLARVLFNEKRIALKALASTQVSNVRFTPNQESGGADGAAGFAMACKAGTASPGVIGDSDTSGDGTPAGAIPTIVPLIGPPNRTATGPDGIAVKKSVISGVDGGDGLQDSAGGGTIPLPPVPGRPPVPGPPPAPAEPVMPAVPPVPVGGGGEVHR